MKQEHRASCTVIAGVPKALQTLRERGWKLALITNLSTQDTPLIKQHGLLDLGDEAVFSCDVGLMKPDAEIYHLALERLLGKPEDAVMIGDSQRADVEGARDSGVLDPRESG